MMGTAPVLCLNSLQVAQVARYCTAYRAYLWQHTMPTPERNQTLRSIQALQGKLARAQEMGSTEIAILFTTEEKQTIKLLLSGLLQWYGTMQPSDQRNQALSEIASLRTTMEHAIRQTRAL